jgi:hypothetical protein
MPFYLGTNIPGILEGIEVLLDHRHEVVCPRLAQQVIVNARPKKSLSPMKPITA